LLHCPSGVCTLGLIKRNPKSSQRLTKTKNLHGLLSKSILNQNVAFQKLYKKGLGIYSKKLFLWFMRSYSLEEITGLFEEQFVSILKKDAKDFPNL